MCQSSVKARMLLKNATRDLHLESERVMLGLIQDDSFNQLIYHSILVALYNLNSQVERDYVKFAVTKRLSTGREKLHWLSGDIHENRGTWSEGNTKGHEIYFDNEAQALGAMYVMEGSMFGGLHIAQMLKKHSWVNTLRLRYFSNYDACLEQKWSEFTSELERYYEKDKSSFSQLQLGAEKAFNHFIFLLKSI